MPGRENYKDLLNAEKMREIEKIILNLPGYYLCSPPYRLIMGPQFKKALSNSCAFSPE